MPFLYHDLYSIYLLFIISLISLSFINDRKQIKTLLLIPFQKQKSYGSLYFQRNMNFSFLRFLYFLLIILITNCFIYILQQQTVKYNFFSLLIIVKLFFITKYTASLMMGFILNKYAKFKKIIIINIDIKAFISLYFLPILFIISYTNFLSDSLIYIVCFLFLTILISAKLMFLLKSNNFIGLKFIDIILYICFLEIIPVIALYISLK